MGILASPIACDSVHCIYRKLPTSLPPYAQQQTATMTEPLTKVDSAVQGLSSSPTEEKTTRRKSSSVPGVYNILDLEEDGTELELAVETQMTGWKINKSPSTVEDPDILKLHLTQPPVKRIDLHFPLGMEVTARNMGASPSRTPLTSSTRPSARGTVRRRARQPLPRRLRVGQGRVLDPPGRPSAEAAHELHAERRQRQQQEEEEGQDRGGRVMTLPPPQHPPDVCLYPIVFPFQRVF